MQHASSYQQQLFYSSWDLLKPLQLLDRLNKVSWDLLKALQLLDWLNKVQLTQDAVTESVCILDVLDGETSSLGTIFVNCQSIRDFQSISAWIQGIYCVQHVLEFFIYFLLLYDQTTSVTGGSTMYILSSLFLAINVT